MHHAQDRAEPGIMPRSLNDSRTCWSTSIFSTSAITVITVYNRVRQASLSTWGGSFLLSVPG